MDDWQLLREYAEGGSEPALEALVGRYLGMVHGIAVREVGEHALAEDVTQAVFALLAKKATELREGTVIAGWLFQTARYAAANATKMERRRRHHEMQAARMNSEELEVGEAATDRLRLLDCALERLGERDRGAVLMRYYRRMEMGEICRTLGVSESAARRRIERAVGKLRISMGVETGASVATEMLGVMGIAAAKTAQSAASGALVVAKGGSGALGQETVNTLMKGAMKMMFFAKMKVAAMVGIGVMVVAGAGTLTVSRLAAKETTVSPSPIPSVAEKQLAGIDTLIRNLQDKLADFRRSRGIPAFREEVVQAHQRVWRLRDQLDDAETRTAAAKQKVDATAKAVSPQALAVTDAQTDYDAALAAQRSLDKRMQDAQIRAQDLDTFYLQYEEMQRELDTLEKARLKLYVKVTMERAVQ
jgi:RNA polymerase sigma factor (sigma-70 family)